MDRGIELFEHELKDIYDAESKLSRELEGMAKKASDEELVEGYLEHKQQTDPRSRGLRTSSVSSTRSRAARRATGSTGS